MSLCFSTFIALCTCWLSLASCSLTGQITNEETLACNDLASSLAEQCIVDGEFVANQFCSLQNIDFMVTQDCPSLDVGEKNDALCDIGIGANCEEPFPATPAPLSFEDNCSRYIEQPGVAACDYYLCREEGLPTQCGQEGYYLGYGYKYCTRYLSTTTHRLSQRGAQWLKEVMSCLMQEIEDKVDKSLTCEEIYDFAFDSHPSCYLDTGFCELKLSDMAWIYFTVDRSDMDMRQVLLTGVACLAEKWRF